MIKVNNKIAANWIKISSDLQSQLIASEEDKIKLSAEVERLRAALTDMVSLFSADDWLTNKAPLPVTHALKAARAALQPEEGNQ